MKEWHFISNDVKQAQDIEFSCWYGDLKGAVKVFMVSRMLVYQVMVAACISDIVTIIIATPHSLLFRNLELHQIKHKLFPV